MKDVNNLIEHLKRIEVYRIPGSDGPMMAGVSEETLVRTIAGIEHLAAENARLTALVHQQGEEAIEKLDAARIESYRQGLEDAAKVAEQAPATLISQRLLRAGIATAIRNLAKGAAAHD